VCWGSCFRLTELTYVAFIAANTCRLDCLLARSQSSSGSMLACGTRGPRIESLCGRKVCVLHKNNCDTQLWTNVRSTAAYRRTQRSSWQPGLRVGCHLALTDFRPDDQKWALAYGLRHIDSAIKIVLCIIIIIIIIINSSILWIDFVSGWREVWRDTCSRIGWRWLIVKLWKINCCLIDTEHAIRSQLVLLLLAV